MLHRESWSMKTKICHDFSVGGQYAGCKCSKHTSCVCKQCVMALISPLHGRFYWRKLHYTCSAFGPNNSLRNDLQTTRLTNFLGECCHIFLASVCFICSLFALCYDTATCSHQQIYLRTPLHLSTWWWPCMPYHTRNACSPGYAMMQCAHVHLLVHMP